MASFNKVILLGNLTRDPEVRYTPKGSAVCDLGLAVNRVYSTDSGEKREEVTYVDVVLWARLAEIAGKNFGAAASRRNLLLDPPRLSISHIGHDNFGSLTGKPQRHGST